MTLPPALVQFLGSLVAILLLAGLAWGLRLGPSPSLDTDEAVARVADETVGGFEAVAIARDENGAGAILRDGAGRILVVRAHGAHFAGRLLTPAARARIDNGTLVVETGEKRFGVVRLAIRDASAWMQAIEAIQQR